MKNNELGLYDRFVIAMAILSGIVGLFKGGLWSMVTGFIFPIVLLYTARALFYWVINPRQLDK